MPLIRLIYASVAREDVDFDVLSNILDHADRANASQHITGALLFTNGHFLQILEGKRAAVNALYLRIAADRRHHTPEILDCTQISARRFGDWSMKHIGADDALTEGRRQILREVLGTERLVPEALMGHQAYQLLLALAKLERSRAA